MQLVCISTVPLLALLLIYFFVYAEKEHLIGMFIGHLLLLMMATTRGDKKSKL